MVSVSVGFGKNISDWMDRDKAYPTKVIIYRYHGQRFWELISGNENLYAEIIHRLRNFKYSYQIKDSYFYVII